MTAERDMSRHLRSVRLTTGALPALSARHDASGRLLFVRHGATDHNLRRLRCGGDLDVDLSPVGREQARDAARRLRRYGMPVGLIVTGSLSRTRETAEIIGAQLGGVPTIEEPLFNERRLGQWNARPYAENEAMLRSGVTPPDGESAAAFSERVRQALDRVRPLLPHEILVVSSSGVGRVLNEILNGGGHLEAGNAEIFAFDVDAPATVEEQP